MFRKLKKKIEDGDVASPERNPFGFSSHSTRMAVPGIPVRLPSETELPQEAAGNEGIEQQTDDKPTEQHAEGIDEDTQVPSDDKGGPTDVEPLDNPKTVAPFAEASVDQTGNSSNVERTPVKASTGWTSLGVKAQGITARIRGDSSTQQHLSEVEKQKEKLEATLERQQDLMVQRLKEQAELHQRELEAERGKKEKLLAQVTATKEKELMEAKNLISKLKSEVDQSNTALEALGQKFTELEAAHSTMQRALWEREEECRQLHKQCSLLREQGSQEGEEKQPSAVEEEEARNAENGKLAPTSEVKEESTPAAVLEVEPSTPTVILEVEPSPPAAILEVKERDIQWTHQVSTDENGIEAEQQLNSTQVSELLDSNRQMQEELMEKGQAIRVLQQKLADLKKTLQKELMQKSHSTGPVHWETPHNPPNRSVSIPAPPNHQQEVDVSYQYLKHVVLRYMCSEGEEARYLVKAISTLLNFSKTEEKRIKEYMDYKVSWFGTKPPPIVPSSNRRNAFPRT